MRKRLVATLGVFAAVITLLLAVGTAHAAPNTARGIDLNNTGYDGLRAVMSVGVGTGSPPAFTFALKSPDVFQFFALQLHPKNSCLQADVYHQRNVGGSTFHRLSFVNWCTAGTWSGTFNFDTTDSTFRSSYVRTISYNDTGTSFQDEVIDVRIYQTNAGTNQWGAYLYNYSTSAWDWKAYSAGTPTQTAGYADIGDGGYTQDATMSCPTLYPWGIFELRGIQKRTTSTGVWANIASGDITGTIADSWPCITTNNYDIKLGTPYQIKLGPDGFAY